MNCPNCKGQASEQTIDDQLIVTCDVCGSFAIDENGEATPYELPTPQPEPPAAQSTEEIETPESPPQQEPAETIENIEPQVEQQQGDSDSAFGIRLNFEDE